MLKGIGVTWRPKSKKVEFIKKCGGGFSGSEVGEALSYCQWRFGYPHKSYSDKGCLLYTSDAADE